MPQRPLLAVVIPVLLLAAGCATHDTYQTISEGSKAHWARLNGTTFLIDGTVAFQQGGETLKESAWSSEYLFDGRRVGVDALRMGEFDPELISTRPCRYVFDGEKTYVTKYDEDFVASPLSDDAHMTSIYAGYEANFFAVWVRKLVPYSNVRAHGNPFPMPSEDPSDNNIYVGRGSSDADPSGKGLHEVVVTGPERVDGRFPVYYVATADANRDFMTTRLRVYIPGSDEFSMSGSPPHEDLSVGQLMLDYEVLETARTPDGHLYPSSVVLKETLVRGGRYDAVRRWEFTVSAREAGSNKPTLFDDPFPIPTMVTDNTTDEVYLLDAKGYRHD